MRSSLRINSNLGRTFFFRVTGGQSGAGVNGDGASQGAPGTVFIVTFNEVLAGTGWRPAAMVACRSCADVVGSVINQTSKAAIAGAFVEALDVLENHPFTGNTASNGRFALADSAGRKCIPSGAVRFRASADRHQPKIHGPLPLPSNGFVDITIELECTNVSGVVVDQADRPLAGVAIALVDILSHAPILGSDGQPFVTTTAMDGSFVFRCVPHGVVSAWLMSDPGTFHPIPVPPEGANVKIVAQTVCGNLIGTVKNAVTLAPIPMATVANIGQTGTAQTNGNGEFRLNCVRPAGSHQLLASAVGFTLGAGFGTVPMAGDSAPVDIRLQPLTVTSIVIRLDWGALPGDLDLRFTGPDNMGGRFQVVWAFPTPVPFVRLDQDVTMGFGPETITLSPLIVGTFVPGIYRVWVLNVTALQSSGTFDMSNAVVTVFTIGTTGMNQIGRFEVAQAAGMQDMPLWHPCDLDVMANGTRHDRSRSIAVSPRAWRHRVRTSMSKHPTALESIERQLRAHDRRLIKLRAWRTGVVESLRRCEGEEGSREKAMDTTPSGETLEYERDTLDREIRAHEILIALGRDRRLSICLTRSPATLHLLARPLRTRERSRRRAVSGCPAI